MAKETNMAKDQFAKYEELGNGTVTDTLNLEERAKLALNGLIGYVDTRYDNIPFMHADLLSAPAYIEHSCWDYGSSTGRLVDAIILARIMSDSEFGKDEELALRKNLMRFFKADGLSYREESPFSEPNANMHDQRAVLLGLTTWYGVEGSEEAKVAADRLCDALKNISIKDKDFWFFPLVEYSEHGWPIKDAVYIHTAADPTHTNGRIINPLVKYHQLTSNEVALELAHYYTMHSLYHSGAYNEDGSFNRGLEFRNGHFHSRMVTLAGMAKYGAHSRDGETLNRVQQIYDWALTQTTSFGWSPGSLRENKAYHHETCTMCDFIEVGIILASNGYSEHWETVERFVRNHLVEAQLTCFDWITEAEDTSMDTKERTYEKVGQRSVGGFAGWAAPNDFVSDIGHTFDIMTCCSAHGTRALYLAWANTVVEEGSRIRVNLLLNRATSAVTVHSFLPHEGKLLIKVHKEIPELLVRIPSWVRWGDVKIERRKNPTKGAGEDSRRRETWKKNYLSLGRSEQGQEFIVTFPVAERIEQESAWDLPMTTKWRGDDVVSISPEGKYNKLYDGRRIHDEAPLKAGRLKKKNDFVW
jgi:hypothetical protein